MTKPDPIQEGLDDYEDEESYLYDEDEDAWEMGPETYEPLLEAYEEVESELSSCFKLGEKMRDRTEG